MRITKRHIFSILVILIISLGVVSVASAYTGTGFSHDIPTSKYSGLSDSDILNKYNKTDCHVEESAICTKVVDGDTIYLDNGEKIRFVGVNTPERGVDGYDTSKNFVKQLCLNKEVGIDIDDSKHNDRYGRTLAVVIVDGKNVNEMLLKEGLAEIMYMPPSEFNPFDWGTASTHVDTTHSSSSTTSSPSSAESTTSSDSAQYIGNANSGKFHSSGCSAANKMSDSNKVFFSSRDDAINQGYTPCKRCNP
ncbi:MAG: thermonuclease family protein [Methanobrevibacter sp.]|uniref:thermonuclease family protein n=1 Tax=Methanobrevibacter sp. TaxID=66852 RepID=UPI003F127CAD